MSLRAGAVQRGLNDQRPRAGRAVLPGERGEPGQAAAAEQHAVGEHHGGQPLGGVAEHLDDVRVQERLPAGEVDLGEALAHRLVDQRLELPRRHGARRRLRGGGDRAVVAGQVAVEVRVHPQPGREVRRPEQRDHRPGRVAAPAARPVAVAIGAGAAGVPASGAPASGGGPECLRQRGGVQLEPARRTFTRRQDLHAGGPPAGLDRLGERLGQPGPAHRRGLRRPVVAQRHQLGAGAAAGQVEDRVPHLAAAVVGRLAQHPHVDHQAVAEPALPGQPGVGAADHAGAAGGHPEPVLGLRQRLPPEVVER